MATEHREYLVYADGSCIGNPGPGGWGVWVRDLEGAVRELNGHEDSTTNNRMELMAAIEGLRATERGARVLLRSDSQYLVKSMTLNYKRNKNHDLWAQLDAETGARQVRFEWVRGHSVDPINNRADELALMGANERLIADGASPAKRSRAGNGDMTSSTGELTPHLKPGELIRECAGCGQKFVTSNAAENYCSHVTCQLTARHQSVSR